MLLISNHCEVSFKLEMKTESEIDKFQFEGPPGITCNQADNSLKCEWTPKEALWSQRKTHFCYTSFVRDIESFRSFSFEIHLCMFIEY